tara:strand:+ start:2058 stop:2282 length:225 start_codon:yes stop_codon:yes gene_type:complete
LEKVVIHRNKLISTIKNLEIELTEKIDKWKKPCPSCNIENKAVYHWNYIESSKLNQIIASENNLKIKKDKKNIA